MDCSLVYYTAYKTGYIQRSLTKKFRTMSKITVKSGYAAVSPDDLQMKFRRALNESELVIVVGGLSSYGENNVMTVLSDYFTNTRLKVDSNKRVLNENGEDGYLIKTGKKYVLVLPDDPEAARNMFGAELLKNIDTANSPGEEIVEPVRTHTVVFAPDPTESGMERLQNKRRASLLTIIGITIAALVVLSAAAWIFFQLKF